MFWAFVQWTLAQQSGQVMYQSLSATDNLVYTEKTWSSFLISCDLVGQVVFLFFFIEKTRNSKIASITEIIVCCWCNFRYFWAIFKPKREKNLIFFDFFIYPCYNFIKQQTIMQYLKAFLVFKYTKWKKGLLAQFIQIDS